MEKKAIFGIILIIAAILIVLYVNAGITKEENLIRRHAIARTDPGEIDSKAPSMDNWKTIPILKTIRFVGYVIGGTGVLLLMVGVIGQPGETKRRGAIYADRPIRRPLDE